jgi:hypothetical protein
LRAAGSNPDGWRVIWIGAQLAYWPAVKPKAYAYPPISWYRRTFAGWFGWPPTVVTEQTMGDLDRIADARLEHAKQNKPKGGSGGVG